MRGVPVGSRASLFLRHGPFLYARTLRALVFGNRCPRRLLPRMLFSARGHLASPWLDLAEDRLRLDRLSRNAVGSTFFPWGTTPRDRSRGDPGPPIPREARKSLRRHPPLRSGPEATPSHRRDRDPDRRVRRRSPSAFRSPSRPRWSREIGR